MVFGTNKSLKKPPGQTGDLTQAIGLILIQLDSIFDDWTINPPYNDGGEKPQDQYWRNIEQNWRNSAPGMSRNELRPNNESYCQS